MPPRRLSCWSVIVGGSTHPSIGGFNPTLTMQAVAYLTADAIVNRYQKSPGPLI
jgi:gluconate 2-dehydrogenase alpha chain